MDSHDTSVVPPDCRKESVCLPIPAEESACLKSDTGQPSKDSEPVAKIQIESKKRAEPVRKSSKSTRSKKHFRRKSKPAASVLRAEHSNSASDDDDDDDDDDDNDDDDDDEGSSTESDMDSLDSVSDSGRDAPKNKKSSHTSRNRPHSHKSKAKHKSTRSVNVRRSGHDGGFDDSKDAAKGDFYNHIDRLELRISQLQAQVAQSSGFAPTGTGGLTYGWTPSLPAAFAPPGGSFGSIMATPNNSGLPIQPTSNGTPPPGRAGRLGLGSRVARDLRRGTSAPRLGLPELDGDGGSRKTQGGVRKAPQKGTKVDFKRVDWVWDSSLYTYKLQDTAEMSLNSLYDEYIFHVRRTFDCEGKYRATFVDVRSKLLRECLQDVIGNVRGASLVDETPKLDPNLLFLYLEDFRVHLRHLKKARPAGEDKKERRKNRTRLKSKRKQLKVLIKYLDKDYAKIKESLYPMLDSGVITFDLLWALWKPNTLVYGTTYGSVEDPRVFKVDMAYHQSTIMRGDFYFLEGKYLEFDGKKFGYGTLAEEIPEFQGARKITSLPCYPLRYHKEQAHVRQNLVERGKKFVALNGVHYKCYSGIAYMKRKKGSIIKFNVQQSRVMVDPAIFRRINPNYTVSMVRPKDHDILSDEGASGDESNYCECDSLDGSEPREKIEYVSKVFKNDKGDVFVAKIPRHETGGGDKERALQSLPKKADNEGDKSPTGSSMNGGEAAETPAETPAEALPDFTEEDYLIASPVVFGFSFSEKQWLELSVSAVKDIAWNEKAWESLVLEPETKDLIKALVQSRKYHAAQTIDDVIQGKGKGLVTVLHGPPGTGKTLTAEGISELLKCPLYMASAGELGTDSRYLEAELQKILDICHAWGAILLLDEADVFLEKRNMQDIHRNALVSIFLRQLEYFQGILFLTTNRVETFDEAFQSRIHIALRYDALDAKAKRTIFKMFIERIKAHGRLELQPFSEQDLDDLARHDLNGREIKNVVGSAQDLAVSKGESFSMRHIRQVLDVHAKFGRDLRGGAGYEDAMRSYF
ncbi:hypothetical protein CDD83_7493 [Cordyceps sp. RAO-2017]|nr:hypothetical protein CDD83_7493 [Cordyceps sp. RAO-2017]